MVEQRRYDSNDPKWNLDLAWTLFNSQEFLFY